MVDNEDNMEMEILKTKWIPIILCYILYASYVQYSTYSSMCCCKTSRDKLTCDMRQEIYVIKAFIELSLCLRLCAHGRRAIGRCHSVLFHVFFSVFFFLVRVSLSFSTPTGQPGCIHQASRFVCLFTAAAPVDPEPQ